MTRKSQSITKRTIFFTAVFLPLLGLMENHVQNTQDNRNIEGLKLMEEWDKTSPKSGKVNHSKVTFINRFGIAPVADLYVSKIVTADKFPAIVVSGPFGAVKEQLSGLYAQILAERGFLAIVFDPSFTGGSSGQPRSVALPDIDVEDFLTVADCLATHPNMGAERIGIFDIYGRGGSVIDATASDTRIKVTVISIIYDISCANANGYFDAAGSAGARCRVRRELNAQCIRDYRTGTYPYTAMNPEPVEDASQLMRGYYGYYKTKRGYHSRPISSGLRWNQILALTFINAPILAHSDEIRSVILLIHRKKAHSRYFSKDTFEELKGDNRELTIIPGTVHTDLYDRMGIIPFDKIEPFLKEHLK